MIFNAWTMVPMATWSNGNAFVSGAEVEGSSPGPVRSDTGLPTACHRYDISSKRTLLSGCNVGEMGLAKSLHASAYCSEYNKRFDLNNGSKTISVLLLKQAFFLLLLFTFNNNNLSVSCSPIELIYNGSFAVFVVIGLRVSGLHINGFIFSPFNLFQVLSFLHSTAQVKKKHLCR